MSLLTDMLDQTLLALYQEHGCDPDTIVLPQYLLDRLSRDICYEASTRVIISSLSPAKLQGDGVVTQWCNAATGKIITVIPSPRTDDQVTTFREGDVAHTYRIELCSIPSPVAKDIPL